MFKIYMVFVIKSNTASKNANQTLNQLNAVIEGLTNNPNFPNTNPAIAELVTKKEELQAAIVAAEGRDRNKIATLKDIVGKTKRLLVTLSADINVQSQGNLTKALTSGFPQRAAKTSAGVLGAPGNARGKALGNGRIVTNWGGLKGRHSYRVYLSLDPNAANSWELRGDLSKNRLVIENLTPGVMYYFRIVGVNNFGEGAFSDVVSVRCV